MHVPKALSLLSVAAISAVSAEDPLTGELGNATVVVNNPPGVVYAAKLPETADFKSAFPDGGNVKGSIAAVANPDGIGVLFKVTFSNLPKEGGPFPYHLHVESVPEDGNCTATGAHLDPFVRGETPACDKKLGQTCQVGDLSGKHGAITSDPFEATYLDPFASTVEDNAGFFGNRSFVIHFANKTRITCANFEKAASSSIGDIATPGCNSPATSAASTSIPTGPALNNTATAPTGTGVAPPASSAPGSTSGPTTIPVSAANSYGGIFAGAASFASAVAAILFML